ncbi:MAG: hypothetical protein ACI35P_15965 [Bacillus sp. (in: firmicutes)]
MKDEKQKIDTVRGQDLKRVERFFGWAVTVAIVIWTILMFVDGRDTKVFMGLLTIASLLLIMFGQKKSSYAFSSAFVIMTYIFIFVSVGLGTFGGAYSIPHFDDFLHLTSGVWMGYGAWVLIQKIIGEKLVDQLPRLFIAIYIIVFALAVAGFWELMEFAGDKLFHFTAQGRDPDDTMFDMIDGLIGGIVAAFFIARKHGRKL